MNAIFVGLAITTVACCFVFWSTRQDFTHQAILTEKEKRDELTPKLAVAENPWRANQQNSEQNAPLVQLAEPLWRPGMVNTSKDIVLKSAAALRFTGFPAGCTVVFDMGTNNGEDSQAFLLKDYCVVGIDANPAMVEKANNLTHKYVRRRLILNLGVAQKVDELTFWITRTKVHSSFDRAKAKAHDPHPKALKVQTILCDALWALINVRPLYMKVDIEERHFVCIEGLQYVPRSLLPNYISWEMHEYARRLPFPVLDVDLILKMYYLGYRQMKIVSNIRGSTHGASFSGGTMPEEHMNLVTIFSRKWVPVQAVLKHGVPNARSRKPVDFWDYHMKLEL